MKLEKLQQITKWATLAFIAGILLYDLWVYLEGGTMATVSAMTVYVWSKSVPAFVVFVGFIMGHLFFPNKGGYWVHQFSALTFTCGALLLELTKYQMFIDRPYVIFGLSFICGGVFWPLGMLPKDKK